MADMCVVRNTSYRKSQISTYERHNERKNEDFANRNIEPERIPLNVHYRSCEGTYTEEFDRLLEAGVISTRGLKADAKVFDELVFDVNSDYFERHGGYEFAKKFYEEVYRFAVGEAGGEEYILSAIMHADEKNKALSEQYGHDVYHYHLHVMYIPVVDKEIKWSKRCKDKSLVGTVKEVVKQVSHSKKWSSQRVVDGQGRTRLLHSYSLLQDRFHQHLQAAGFTDIERGKRGSTAEHLDVLDFQIQQDSKRLAVLGQDVQAKQKQAAILDKKLAIKKKAAVVYRDIDGMARRSKSGKIILEPKDWEALSGMAKEGVIAKANSGELKKRLADVTKRLDQEKAAYNRLYKTACPFLDAVKVDPERAQAAAESITQQHYEHHKKQQRSSAHSR